MQEKTAHITVTIIYAGETFIMQAVKNEYRNLMQMITDKIFIDDYGYCRGMGRCGTCMVRALNRHYSLPDYDRNELNTISRSDNTLPDTRLSCQLQIDEAIDGIIFEIIETI